MVGAAEKAIADSNLGLSPATEGGHAACGFLNSNEERRKEYREGRAQIRRSGQSRGPPCPPRRPGRRQEAREESRDFRDDHERPAHDVQKATDATIVEIDQLLAAKEKKSSPSSVIGSTNVKAAAPATEDRSNRSSLACGDHHVDGNGRWRCARGLPRAEGHRCGVSRRCAASSAPRMNSAFAIRRHFPSARRSGRGPRSKSAICSVCSGASSATIWRACIATASACA